MQKIPHILIVDDDLAIRKLLGRYLTGQGYRVSLASDQRSMKEALAVNEVSLIVLDVLLPDGSGLDICRNIRREGSEIPVILLTALKEDVDRIIGLEIGADDYLGKPFNPRELAARIRAILRRREPDPIARRRIAVGDILVDLESRSAVRAREGEIALTSAEFDLLECFLTRPQRALSREQLMDWTRGRRAEPLDRTLDVQVSRLRKKIEGGGEPLIKTVRNAGYMLCAAVKER